MEQAKQPLLNIDTFSVCPTCGFIGLPGVWPGGRKGVYIAICPKCMGGGDENQAENPDLSKAEYSEVIPVDSPEGRELTKNVKSYDIEKYRAQYAIDLKLRTEKEKKIQMVSFIGLVGFFLVFGIQYLFDLDIQYTGVLLCLALFPAMWYVLKQATSSSRGEILK